MEAPSWFHSLNKHVTNANEQFRQSVDHLCNTTDYGISAPTLLALNGRHWCIIIYLYWWLKPKFLYLILHLQKKGKDKWMEGKEANMRLAKGPFKC